MIGGYVWLCANNLQRRSPVHKIHTFILLQGLGGLKADN